MFLFLLVVFVFMKNGDAKKIAAQAENKILSETPVETKTPEEPLPEMKNPRIVVKKADRKLEVFDGEKLIKTYRVGLGFAPVGDKEKQGDGKTPEGEFYIFTKNDQSRFYLSIGVSYPSTRDAERGFRENLISKSERDEIVEAIKNKKMPLQNTKLGGEIYIHGNGSSSDWTLGCVALEDKEMKELFDAIPVGANVKIEP
jgi:murein L,D-transpeptidase YafK